jgi:hypothetical protein
MRMNLTIKLLGQLARIRTNLGASFAGYSPGKLCAFLSQRFFENRTRG